MQTEICPPVFMDWRISFLLQLSAKHSCGEFWGTDYDTGLSCYRSDSNSFVTTTHIVRAPTMTAGWSGRLLVLGNRWTVIWLCRFWSRMETIDQAPTVKTECWIPSPWLVVFQSIKLCMTLWRLISAVCVSVKEGVSPVCVWCLQCLFCWHGYSCHEVCYAMRLLLFIIYYLLPWRLLVGR